jgi:hypothetical protein
VCGLYGVFITALYADHIKAGFNQFFQACSVSLAAGKIGAITNKAHFTIVFGLILSFYSTGLVWGMQCDAIQPALAKSK